jgi:uncharacterized RDD family membrane protein YckC
MINNSLPEYKIIGGDDAEYGPASLDELKGWIRDGRVADQTKVWRSDLAMWSSADRYTELHEELSRLNADAAMLANREARPVGFWARFGAYLIDHFLLSVVFIMVWIPIANGEHWAMPALPTESTQAALQQFSAQFNVWLDRALPVFYPIFLIYEVLLNGRFGATLGKMAIGAKITMVDGSPIGYGRASLRWFAERLSDFALFTGYLLILVRSDKRALHDLLAGTKVIYKR